VAVIETVEATRFRLSSFFALDFTGEFCSNSQGCVRGPLKVNVVLVGVEGVPNLESPPVEWTRRCFVGVGVELAMLAKAGKVVAGWLVWARVNDAALAWMARAR